MKRLGVFAVVFSMVLLSNQSVFSQEWAKDKIPFKSEFGQLEKYLNLTTVQLNEVYNINEYFIEQQKRYLIQNYNPKVKNRNFQQIVYGNLKLMKDVLTEDQYRKYVALVNVTYQNKLGDIPELPNIYLALSEEGNKK